MQSAERGLNVLHGTGDVVAIAHIAVSERGGRPEFGGERSASGVVDIQNRDAPSTVSSHPARDASPKTGGASSDRYD